MKANIIKIGNSQGIRLPKPVLEQCGLKGVVTLSVKGRSVVITAEHKRREGWDKSFASMTKAGDDRPLLNEEDETDWDKEDWQW